MTTEPSDAPPTADELRELLVTILADAIWVELGAMWLFGQRDGAPCVIRVPLAAYDVIERIGEDAAKASGTAFTWHDLISEFERLAAGLKGEPHPTYWIIYDLPFKGALVPDDLSASSSL